MLVDSSQFHGGAHFPRARYAGRLARSHIHSVHFVVSLEIDHQAIFVILFNLLGFLRYAMPFRNLWAANFCIGT